MDSRRPPYVVTAPPPTAHDPRPHHHHHHHQQQPLHPQQQPYPPPPPPPYTQQPQQHPHHHQQQQQQQHPQQHPHHGPPPRPHPQQQQQPPPGPPPPLQQQQQQHPPQQSYPGAPNLPPPQGPALPPIQPAAHAPPATSSEQQNLPSFRHPSAPPPHDQREGGPPEYHYQYTHNRSGHATPAPVNRSYSHDSGPQRSPATPAGPGPGAFPPSSGQDGAPPPPGPPPPHQMDHGHHGYPPTNGNLPHGLPPPGPPPHQHHEQYPPPQPTPIMDSHYSQYPPPNQPMYGGAPQYGGPTSSNLYGTKRKQMRATQACEQCRQRKQKCDEGSPCSFCKENSLTCQYRDTPPAKTDKNMEKLLNYMEAHTHGLQELTSKIDSFEQRLRRVEHSAQESDASTSAGAQQEPPIMDDRELPKRKPELDDHRTAPHKLLLLWPTVRPLLRRANVEHNDGYVMEAEDRGVLRLWTRGEGIDENDGTQPGGPASPARSDESGEGAAATPHADGLWGVGFPSTPNSDARRSEPYGAGGLKANGEVDLDQNTINTLYDSYMRHIHILHPFLDKRRLRKMFDNFIRRYSTGRPRAAFAVGIPNHLDSDQRPLKRQRSNGSTANIATGSDSEMRKEQTERSPGNAIIYLVLALGKICTHKGPLPAVVADSKLQANSVISHQISGNRGLAAGSPVSVNIKPSPMSPKSTPTTQPTPPSEAGMRLNESRSRRSSIEGSPSSAHAGPRNLDVIPGIAYYAKAAEILGDQGDGNDLVHAQMFLLAGLYKGQLARVKESMSWITMAGRAISILLDRYKLYNDNYWTAYGDVRRQHERAQKRIKDTRQSLIVLASWTCLQLESDILAELRLPSSGIQNIENLLLMPHKVPDDESYSGLEPDGRQEDYDNILIYYTAQLFLRRRLNQVHREMYGPECLNQPLSAVQEMLLGHENILTTWRRQLPGLLNWDDNDPPASDILSARLRAKYYGAKYIINRPFLDYALHIMPGLRDGHPMEAVARDGYGNPRDKADIHLFRAIENLGETTVWQAARRCVDAAMNSTIAFDGVPGRLIVTNIHGTAHAQFGNMLVLCATFTTDFMKQIIQTDKFQERLQRTIGFLRKLAPISPTCAADCGILEKFNNILFPVSSEQPDIYHNEGVEPMSATNSFGGHST